MKKKVIVITGGSSGLGKSITQELVQENTVIIIALNAEKLKQVSKELNCDYRVCNIADYNEVEKVITSIIEKYHKIDVLINNAGVWTEGELCEVNVDNINKIIDINTKGTIFMTKVVISNMINNKNGTIINIISSSGMSARAGGSIYATSKWAINGFTKCMNLELAKYGIRVTGLYPYLMDTNLFDDAKQKRDMSKAVSTTDVAKTIKYILSLNSDISIPEFIIKNINN